MFYLGSIAGILPYILVFSLTLVLGGHAGLPFFTSALIPESKNKINKEENFPAENLENLTFDNQIVIEKITPFLVPFCTRITVCNFCLFRLFDSTEFGFSLLRAPPISPF